MDANSVRCSISARPHGYTVFDQIIMEKMYKIYPCGADDTELHTLFASSGYSPKWRYGDADETNC